MDNWKTAKEGNFPPKNGLYRVQIKLDNGRLFSFENEYSSKKGFTFDTTMRELGKPQRILAWRYL
ncbi:hypothetical protein ACWA5Z_12150 [Testudinibacter sp. P80/BLE/0925]|uniref:hypothetical protein n=1 Tax=Testudinibacter sp. TW-1 TaxID=3417757 RepID=UPI003D36232B